MINGVPSCIPTSTIEEPKRTGYQGWTTSNLTPFAVQAALIWSVLNCQPATSPCNCQLIQLLHPQPTAILHRHAIQLRIMQQHLESFGGADPKQSRPSTTYDELETRRRVYQEQRTRIRGSRLRCTHACSEGKIQEETAYHKLPRLTGVKKQAGASGCSTEEASWHKQTLHY